MQQESKQPTKKYKVNQTKNKVWDEWRSTDYVFVPVYIYAYVIKMRPAWRKRKGETPKLKALNALTEFLGRPPENDELQQVTRTRLMTHSLVHFALAVFAMNKGIPFESLEKYYFRNKAWADARAQLRKELKLGKNDRYVLIMSEYERYVQYFSRLTAMS